MTGTGASHNTGKDQTLTGLSQEGHSCMRGPGLVLAAVPWFPLGTSHPYTLSVQSRKSSGCLYSSYLPAQERLLPIGLVTQHSFSSGHHVTKGDKWLMSMSLFGTLWENIEEIEPTFSWAFYAGNFANILGERMLGNKALAGKTEQGLDN